MYYNIVFNNKFISGINIFFALCARRMNCKTRSQCHVKNTEATRMNVWGNIQNGQINKPAKQDSR